MNNGLLRGMGPDLFQNFPMNRWLPYGPEAGENYPLVDATAVTPNLGTGSIQRARFMVIPGFVFAYVYAAWGNTGSGGSGKLGVLMPPVGSPSLWNSVDTTSFGTIPAQTIGFTALTKDTFGVAHMETCSASWGNVAANQIPANRFATLNPHRWFFSDQGTPAQITVGNSTVTVTHGAAATPDCVLLTPASSPSASGVGSYWVSNITATTFQINTNVNVATQALQFKWRVDLAINAANAGGIFVTDTWPWAWGANGNTIEVRMYYPLAGIG